MEKLRDVRDIGDSIRIENSAFTPEQDNQMRSLIGACCNKIESKFGSYIPEATRERARTISYTTFAVDNPIRSSSVLNGESDFAIEFSDHVTDISGTYPFASTVHLNGVSFIFVQDTNTWWDHVPPESRKEIFEDFPNETEAKNPLAVLYYIYNLAHELGHVYHNPRLPKEFSELTAEFIAQEISVPQWEDDVTVFVRGLVQKYGQDVYRVMFGTCRNPITRFRILRELTSQKYQQLMPERAQRDYAVDGLLRKPRG